MKFGIGLFPNMETQKIISIIKMADDAGFMQGWIMDEGLTYPCRDAYGIINTVASQTKNIHLGPGISNPYTRYPAMIAIAIATVYEAWGGRALLGLGPGGDMSLDPLGLKWKKPVETVRETTELCRALFTGKPVEFKGDQIKYTKGQLFTPCKIPIYIGARGPRMLRLVGEVADGGLVHVTPHTTKNTVGQIKEGAKRSKDPGRGIDIAHMGSGSILKREEEAREVVKPNVGTSVALMPEWMLVKEEIPLEEVNQIKKVAREKGWWQAKDLVTDHMIDTLSIAGNPDSVIERLHQMEKQGVTAFVISGPFGSDIKETFELLRNQIIPSFE